MGYETTIVAFVEILGLNNAIDKSIADGAESGRILESINELKDFFSLSGDDSELESSNISIAATELTQISNSLVVSRKIRDENGIYRMLTDCSLAVHRLIGNGFLCSGAIKVGNLFSINNPHISDTYIKAWLAESNSQLPIITFESELLDSVRYFQYPPNKGSEVLGTASGIKNCTELIPGIYYLDYFSDYQDYPGSTDAAAHYSKLREIIEKGLQIPTAFDKYRWCADQFNKSAAEYDLDKIEQL